MAQVPCSHIGICDFPLQAELTAVNVTSFVPFPNRGAVTEKYHICAVYHSTAEAMALEQGFELREIRM
ncbi:hypothetical protein AV530_012260 [Patagioenas fasciata monilis]|uniref:Uncharacterized protein n=1 Tax=Patagioenas fasciata monilis TaxID=372326 RepID=A0A1V4J3L3_PATFA|nr:hypothetical protein AV530_012260 [Patagioenas fasciata monilis]